MKIPKNWRETCNRGAKNGNHGYRISKLYPSESLRNRLVGLGVPRSKHNLAELGEMLPVHFYSYKDVVGKYWVIEDDMDNECECCAAPKAILNDSTLAETEADARAKMLIWLIERNYLKLGRANENT